MRLLLKFVCTWRKAHSPLFRLFFPAKEKSTKEAPFPHPALEGAGMHSAKRLTAFAKLAKGRCVITLVSARGATVRARTGFATPHSGARPSRGGSPPRRLPPCTHALRRGRVKHLQDGFRHIGERFVRSLVRPPFVSAHRPFGDQPKAQVASPSRIRA